MDSLGSKGEHRISEWLTNKGYLILERNWRIRTGEIDRIIKTAKHFLVNNRKYNKMYIRFDVVVLRSNPFLEQPLQILHLKDAFGDCYD